MKNRIALLTGMLALTTTSIASACGGSGGYQVRSYSAPSYGYAQPSYHNHYRTVHSTSWQTPVATVVRPEFAPPTIPQPSVGPVTAPAIVAPLAPVAAPVVDNAPANQQVKTIAPVAKQPAEAASSVGAKTGLTSAETIALLKLLGPKDLQ